MIVLDVNVVVAAHRGDHPQHGLASSWLGQLVERQVRFGAPAFVWASFLRITTNRRVFEVPTPLDDAFAFIDAVRAQPTHVPVEPGEQHLALLRQACADGDAVGDLIPDAYLVALALEHGAELASFDRDFARFPGLRWIVPNADDGAERGP